MAALELDEYIRLGNIKNSVNFPNVSVPFTGGSRVCLCHDNVPDMISKISGTFSAQGINIDNLVDQTRGDNAYSVIDVNTDVPESVINALSAIKGVNRVRVIK